MDSKQPQDELAALVVKTGVCLGGLTQPQRELALAVAALALPRQATATEAQVNALLKRVLEHEAAFMATDHVELRRWLVDTGWWQRDGFGRAYGRTPSADLRPALQALEGRLAGVDLPRWVAERCDAQRRQREARRAAWSSSVQGDGAARA